MKSDELIKELKKSLYPQLAKDFVSEFVEIRNECKTNTLGKTSVGKFVETFDKKPSVDRYLRSIDSQNTNLNDDLKIVCSRIARAIYTLRNKRNIAHKGCVNPNIYDLKFIYASAQWILSEIVRQLITSDMELSGKMIEFIQIPVDSVVEEFESGKLIYGDLSVRDEILVLIHSYYPDFVNKKDIISLPIFKFNKVLPDFFTIKCIII